MFNNSVFVLRSLLIFLSFLFSCAVTADQKTDKTPEAIISSELVQALGVRPQWLALGHYSKVGIDAWRSSIADNNYFLADDGRFNPISELKETVRLFLSDSKTKLKCQYIARYKWLQTEVSVNAIELPDLSCEEYDIWVEKLNNPDKLVLVFPAAYINAPASMFGHTLLRFDTDAIEGVSNSYLLSMSVNFAANVPKDTGAASYIFKGMAGGFYGQYSIVPYYENIRTYNRIENRDIWEYTLNLSGNELQRIIDHLWDLRGINFEYYFLKQNCSYRLLELLEVARPQLDLTKEFPLTAIPANTVRALVENKFVISKYYRPSEARILDDIQRNLNILERQLIKKLASPEFPINTSELDALGAGKKSELVSIAHKLAHYRINDKKSDGAALQDRSYELVQQLAILPPPVFTEHESDVASPDTGHKTSRLGILYGTRKRDEYMGITYRPSIHDILDRQEGYERGAEIALLDISVDIYSNTIYFDRLDLFRIRSLTASNEFFDPIAWSAHMGAYRDYLYPEENIAGIFDIGVGKNYEADNGISFYGLFTTSIEINENYRRNTDGSLGGWIGMLWQAGLGAGEVALRGKYYFLNETQRYYGSLSQQFDIKINHALRVKGECGKLEQLEECDVGVSYFYYF